MLSFIFWTGASIAAVQAQSQCQREDFMNVVDEAASVLRELNTKNKPAFQAKLGLLKEKRGWDHSTFLEKAAPFVQDEQIAAFEQASRSLLARISQMGEAGDAAVTPDCSVLAKLRAAMQEMVRLQTEKWRYMVERLDAEIAKPN